MKGQFTNLDANESAFLLRQLEHVKTKAYDVKYPEYKSRMFIPVSFETPAGADTITYFQYDAVGLAKVIANYAKDLPRVDLVGKAFTNVVRSLGSSYGYSRQDIRRALMVGMPLQQRKADAAKKALYALCDQLALTGDADTQITGLLSNPNITDVAAPNNAGATSTLWANKTAAEILADLFTLDTKSADLTLGVETPDTLLLPLSQRTLLARMQMPNINMTVLQYFLANASYIRTVEVWEKLKGAGAGGTDVAVAYKKDPDKLTQEIPLDFDQTNPQEDNLDYKVACEMRYGGVIIYYPLSVTLMHLI